MYKTAILGCGERSHAHALAYAGMTRAHVVASCSRNTTIVDSFCNRHKISGRYTSLEQMLDKEKPDLLHIVTAPKVRYEVMKQASDAHVPIVIVEKPIALQAEDWRQIVALEQTSSTRFIVNTQLHFHPRNLQLKQDVAAGAIGEVRLIEASARSTPVNQGPHILQLAASYLFDAPARRVLAQVAGDQHLHGDRELSPDNALASVAYDNNVHAHISLGVDVAPLASSQTSPFLHKQVTVHGSHGYVRWGMYHWEKMTLQDGYEHGQYDYFKEDAKAQTSLTEAAIDWLDDQAILHPTRLSLSLSQFNVLLAMYTSAVSAKVVDLPFEPPDQIIEKLRTYLS